MNPYDFVRIDWNRPPQRRKPVWHHQLIEPGQQLYSGHLEIDMYAETPLFIIDPRSTSNDPRKPCQSVRNKQGEYIVPGSSLKGMLRTVVESLGSGCLTLFDSTYEKGKILYSNKIAEPFYRCSNNNEVCLSCRTFGMMRATRAEGESGKNLFLGNVNIGDACTYADSVYLYDPIYTIALVEPKPHHRDFYLDEKQQYIAGRKYYFHHHADQRPIVANGPIYFGKGRDVLANRYIQPLDCDTKFHFRLDFNNLEADEFAALLLAITLEKNMRHKIGYAKPLGLGSVSLEPTSITLIDFASRYTQPGPNRGKTIYAGDELWKLCDKHVNAFKQQQLVQVAWQDLQRIWRWPADPDIDYYYPSKRDWFDTDDSLGKRIADTRTTP